MTYSSFSPLLLSTPYIKKMKKNPRKWIFRRKAAVFEEIKNKTVSVEDRNGQLQHVNLALLFRENGVLKGSSGIDVKAMREMYREIRNGRTNKH